MKKRHNPQVQVNKLMLEFLVREQSGWVQVHSCYYILLLWPCTLGNTYALVSSYNTGYPEFS